MNEYYIVIMYRWGLKSNHSYCIGLFDKKKLAIKAGTDEEINRGRKYSPLILSYKLNKPNSKKVIVDLDLY